MIIRKGDPLGKSSLVAKLTAGLAGESSLFKKSVHGADAAFCSRKATLHQAVAPHSKIPMEASSQFYFGIGNAIHSAVADALFNSGILIANEFPVGLFPIKGFIDNIVISDETGGLKIIDVKTCGKLPSSIKPGQAEQLLLYALLSGIQEASILYVSRSVANFSGLLIKEIPAPISKPVMQKIARVAAESIVYSKYKLVPPRPDYHITESGCGWCPFKRSGCFSDEDGIHKAENGFSYGSGHEDEIAEIATNLFNSKADRYKNTLAQLDDSPRVFDEIYKKWKAENGI